MNALPSELWATVVGERFGSFFLTLLTGEISDDVDRGDEK